jgi:hypothetical protein
MPARRRLLASKEDPVPSGRVLSEERPLPVFDTSRSHQLTWMSGFGGAPSPFARDIKQSNVPGSQASGGQHPTAPNRTQTEIDEREAASALPASERYSKRYPPANQPTRKTL